MIRKILCFSFTAAMLWTGMVLTQEKKDFTADRHKSRGLKCEACHGEAQPKTAATGASCLKCHKSLEAVAERTKDFEKNPHDNHMTQSSDIECTQCHKAHKADVILCEQCHSGMKFEKANN